MKITIKRDEEDYDKGKYTEGKEKEKSKFIKIDFIHII